MLKIDRLGVGSKLTVALEGRLDTVTAPQLEKEIKEAIDGVTDLTIDAAKLEYISSAGLRAVLGARKAMGADGTFAVRNLCSDVKEIFDITGFSDIITIE